MNFDLIAVARLRPAQAIVATDAASCLPKSMRLFPLYDLRALSYDDMRVDGVRRQLIEQGSAFRKPCELCFGEHGLHVFSAYGVGVDKHPKISRRFNGRRLLAVFACGVIELV